MLEAIDQLDRQLLYFLNSYHSWWADELMVLATHRFTWVPLYLALAIWLLVKYKRDGLILVLGCGLVLALSDQISASIIKPWAARLRPSHNPDVLPGLQLVDDIRGGLYGFVSSHASNSAAVATFLLCSLRTKPQWLVLSLAMWVLLVSYSRIYLGVHYPTDILAGWAIGFVVGLLCSCLLARFRFLNLRAVSS